MSAHATMAAIFMTFFVEGRVMRLTLSPTDAGDEDDSDALFARVHARPFTSPDPTRRSSSPRQWSGGSNGLCRWMGIAQ
jgi:hypothetical protein